MLAEELLTWLRVAVGSDVDFAEPPVRLSGGFYTANYRFLLRGAPAQWVRPMVLRLFPTHAPSGIDEWEVAVQNFVHDNGLPAPGVALYDRDARIDGRRWFVMELMPGSAAMAGTRLPQLVADFPRMVSSLPRLTAEIHLNLHRVDPAPLVEVFGASASFDRWFVQATAAAAPDAYLLQPGLDWLAANKPEPKSALVLCHGDSWGGNLLLDDGNVSALLDWTLAVVAEPALDVGFLTALLSLAPGVPRGIHPIARAVGQRLAHAYRSAYESGSDADLQSVPYYEALRCLLELSGVVAYRAALAHGLPYDGPRPAWDLIAGRAVDYFRDRTGITLTLS